MSPSPGTPAFYSGKSKSSAEVRELWMKFNRSKRTNVRCNFPGLIFFL